jgi:tetratricopeptide (TPR) repeat protein
MPRKKTVTSRPDPARFDRHAEPATGSSRRRASLSRGKIGLVAALVATAALVRLWESDWMLERQAAHASPAELRSMAERMPGSAVVHYHLARALAEARDTTGAIDELNKARQIDPESARTVTLLSDQLAQSARFSEAGALAESFARSHPSSSEAQYALGVYLYRVFARPRAAEALRKAVQLDPRDARAWRTLGESLLALDKFGEAAGAFTKAIEIEPRDVQTRIRRGMARSSSQDLAHSEADFREALRMDPRSPEAKFWLADFLARNGRDEQAKQEAERLFRSLLNDPAKAIDAELALGRILDSRSQWPEAEPLLAAYTAARPRNTEGLYLYGKALRGLHKPADAVFARFHALKKVEEARRDLLSRLQIQQDNVPLRLQLARLLAANGEPAFAIVCYERALRLAPSEQVRGELAGVRARLDGGQALAR